VLPNLGQRETSTGASELLGIPLVVLLVESAYTWRWRLKRFVSGRPMRARFTSAGV
jgi:hypothetical protein